MARPLGEVVLAHVEEGEVGENVEDPKHLWPLGERVLRKIQLSNVGEPAKWDKPVVAWKKMHMESFKVKK